MTRFTRRGLMAAGAAAATVAMLPRSGTAQHAPAMALRATSRTLDIDGKAATVWGLSGPSGPGLVLAPGQRFRVDLSNDLPEPTLIHWHGQIPPNDQDGVPDLPRPLLQPGQTRSYDYAPLPGTYWMHAHIPLQEMRLLAAPLIVHAPEDAAADRQEVVMFLHDFSFRSPEEVMASITGAAPAGHGAIGHDMMAMGDRSAGEKTMPMPGMSMQWMGDMPGMSGMAMDLNDYDWDAYLANDRTLSDPEAVAVDKGGRVRLQIINASAATVFWIDTGALPARLVAVDGQGIEPIAGTRFGIAMAQRLDLDLDLAGAGAWPILALREGARERTGLILATPGAQVARLAPMGEAPAPAFDIDLAQESRLVARAPLAVRAPDRSHMVMLGGTMQPYLWTIDGRTWADHLPLQARSGERVEIMFHNMSMMAHPMHLHGHSFQVVALNGRRIAGARRDTVLVPPMMSVTVALDAGEAARWMLHCHHMPHLQTGMMTELAIS
ncbi:multicopper oxidase domain-containing protein [Paracoccus limosus]|uniref:Multicopper oxidase domain-containing protein n=1 Tax=Paracoccus limosus TaxID=913252 RepID=A0A844H7M7_9RHOB|nr:multicopper oxidase family protein [Paracoccus limosus]MTH34348.1 multicopper oxidase domain-containing protein [Paracoccus limosus]